MAKVRGVHRVGNWPGQIIKITTLFIKGRVSMPWFGKAGAATKFYFNFYYHMIVVLGILYDNYKSAWNRS
jgi:hypothetical protein